MTQHIEIESLSKHFGSIKAVDNVSFNVSRGEVLGFLGPNGAGKSTTMKMLASFLLPTSGTARVMGYDIINDPIKVKRSLGYLPEGAPAYGDMTPKTYLEFIGQARDLSNKKLKSRLSAVVEKTHIQAVLNQPIETLSKGFKRRVGIAQALIHDPEVLILDEPTDGLDPNQKYEVRKLIQEMASEKAIIISTHILEEVDAVCSRAIIISNGKIIIDMKPSELKAQSENHNVIHIAIKPDHATVARTTFIQFDAIKRVEKLSEDETQVEYVIYPKNGANMIHEISNIVRDRGWSAGEIRIEKGQLDDVFRQVTSSQRS
jgi:gliding motility-associated transport system ATP-binding protein